MEASASSSRRGCCKQACHQLSGPINCFRSDWSICPWQPHCALPRPLMAKVRRLWPVCWPSWLFQNPCELLRPQSHAQAVPSLSYSLPRAGGKGGLGPCPASSLHHLPVHPQSPPPCLLSPVHSLDFLKSDSACSSSVQKQLECVPSSF